jgi:hypothetical protein
MRKGGGPGITGKYISNPETGQNDLYEYRRFNGSDPRYAFFKNGVELTLVSGSPPARYEPLLPEKIRFIPLKEDVLFCPKMKLNISSPYHSTYPNGVNVSVRYTDVGFTSRPFGRNPFPTTATISTPGSLIVGNTLLLPVAYVFTGVFENEEEILIGYIETPDPPPPSLSSTIWYPNESVTNYINITFGLATVPNLKYVNVYRAFGGAAQNGKFYKFTQRLLYQAGNTTLTLIDFGSEDISQNPPLNIKLIQGNNGLTHAKDGMYYQQRLFISYDKDSTIKSGEVGVSKLGCPRELKMPAIFNNLGAFQFSVPVFDSSSVVGFLAMERGIVFTEKAVYVLRGGEQGVITPTSVNPLLISNTGCSSIVEPKMKGRKGYYLNNDHTKLMGILFVDDANLRVFEVSIFSDHLITSDIFKMEVVSGKEDQVYLLKRDGTMIGVTVGPDFNGFYEITTDGFIENIMPFKSLKTYYPNIPLSWPVNNLPENDCLFAYVIRDGVRHLEAMIVREDVYEEGMIYVDAASTFGERLSLREDSVYYRLSGNIPPVSIPQGFELNINGGTTWTAGETVFIESVLSLPLLTTQKLFFYYENSEGIVRRILWTPDGGTTTPVTPGYSNAYTGTFSEDIPPQLQDVRSQPLSPDDMIKALTRYLPAYNSISGLTHLANREVSVFADGKVYSSPNNPEMPTLTVSAGGVLTLPEYVAWGVVGLPYVSEMETLDLEASDGRTFTDSNKLINAVGIAFTNSRGGHAGIESQGVSNMAPINYKPYEGVSADEKNFEGHVTIPIPAQWSEKGRVNIKQFDPLPLTVLSVYPKGMVGN